MLGKLLLFKKLFNSIISPFHYLFKKLYNLFLSPNLLFGNVNISSFYWKLITQTVLFSVDGFRVLHPLTWPPSPLPSHSSPNKMGGRALLSPSPAQASPSLLSLALACRVAPYSPCPPEPCSPKLRRAAAPEPHPTPRHPHPVFFLLAERSLHRGTSPR
jgi:hypothetical protein